MFCFVVFTKTKTLDKQNKTKMEFEKPNKKIYIKREKHIIGTNSLLLDVPSAGDHLYEIRKRPVRDAEALQSVVMVLKQEKKGKPVSATAKKNRQKMKTLRKKGIKPRVTLLRRHQRSVTHSISILKKIQESAMKKAAAEALLGNDEKKKARGGIANQVAVVLKAAEQTSAVLNHYTLEFEKLESALKKHVTESQKIQNHFEILTDSVLAWGKNVIKWTPPNAWEIERLPVTLYQLRVHNEMDDPAEKFSTDKKKRAKARAKRKRREQTNGLSSVATATENRTQGIIKTIQIIKPRIKKQKI